MIQDLKDCVILHKDSFNRLLRLAWQDKMWPTRNEIADIEEEARAQDLSGMRLVPLEPTEDQYEAARDWSYEEYGKPIGKADAAGLYKAMKTAALKAIRRRNNVVKMLTRCHAPFNLYAYDDEGFLYKAQHEWGAREGLFKALRPCFPRFRNPHSKTHAHYNIQVDGKKYQFFQENRLFRIVKEK